MAKSAARKILVADTPEELEQQLADLSAEAGPKAPPEPPIEPGPSVPPDLLPEDPVPDPDDPDQQPVEYPDEGDPEDDPIVASNDLRRSLYTSQRTPAPLTLLDPAPLQGQVIDRPATHYESRIVIVDAWQYPGGLQNAPEFVDRNWAGYGDDDPLRGIPPGPCLRVPSYADPGTVVLCRIGDYVAQQEVKLDARSSDLRVEVWPRETFHKMFIPT